MRTRLVRPATAALLTAGALTGALVASPAQATEYSSALKISGVQYDAPGRDGNGYITFH
ncbi:hypothetical protein GCM10010305_02350 [Streptomyces termitum]|uniref:Uncharacterized protein n=1 Tax=Streptomyces termitum TaxID=67368 RepID=A0A918SQR7_9ACTN|nr:hypothetical protein GCM10010305_02350 [Streptomyces termitum]